MEQDIKYMLESSGIFNAADIADLKPIIDNLPIFVNVNTERVKEDALQRLVLTSLILPELQTKLSAATKRNISIKFYSAKFIKKSLTTTCFELIFIINYSGNKQIKLISELAVGSGSKSKLLTDDYEAELLLTFYEWTLEASQSNKLNLRMRDILKTLYKYIIDNNVIS